MPRTASTADHTETAAGCAGHDFAVALPGKKRLVAYETMDSTSRQRMDGAACLLVWACLVKAEKAIAFFACCVHILLQLCPFVNREVPGKDRRKQESGERSGAVWKPWRTAALKTAVQRALPVLISGLFCGIIALIYHIELEGEGELVSRA